MNANISSANPIKEIGEPSTWIFQGNPQKYDVLGAVNALDKLTWAVNQSPRKIHNGDKAYIWMSGPDGGIIASGTIICDPEMREPNPTDPYNRGNALKTAPYLAVDIQIERRLAPGKVTRTVLLGDERTKQLEILTYPPATNFSVTKTQEEVIESVINGTYARAPTVDEPDSEIVGKRRHWLFSPGKQAEMWEEFSTKGIMGIGWDDIGDLTRFGSKSDIKSALKGKYGASTSHINNTLAVWQFTHEVAIGDIVFAKRGQSAVIGRGVVESDYVFDASRNNYKNIRKVKWTQKGEWKHPGLAVTKTLTDITQYTEYVSKLEALVRGENEVSDDGGDPEIAYQAYSDTDFLEEVFIGPEQYAKLKGLLLRKKNVIVQGAPGVGKTFAAQRLAFALMEARDTSRTKIIQFHQSYGYEDFVMGYRPDASGFSLAEGPFYKFCKTAEDDDERRYFFIIDEINRGNLGKIFGELLLLIESDKRGKNNAMRLLYRDEQFSVPANVYIIGMMNTADRSLAMIDYALRRRFAFFDMEPAFSSDGFKNLQKRISNARYDALVAQVEKLNEEIADDPSLGAGFRIGHSYFCPSEPTVVDGAWLSSVVEYELIPLLHEYWFDEPQKTWPWLDRLRSAING
ncbi:MAG: EVE domain-containing protein [Planctomycetota bacterium]|jgi:hypothetical protein|nr:EVE domain-containing protein [Planctomycetota bacterium]